MTAHALYRGGRDLQPGRPAGDRAARARRRVAWLGADADAPAADVTVDLDGALVTPAFVDAHVHATDTGLALAGLDLSATRSAAQLLDAVAARAAGLPGDAVVLGHGWDESTWARPGHAAGGGAGPGGGRPAGLPVPGVDPLGAGLDRFRSTWRAATRRASTSPAGCAARRTTWCGRSRSGRSPPAQRTEAQRTALRQAASLGIAAVHECGGPGTSSEDDFTGLLALSGQRLPEVYGFWGELMGAAKARELGAVGAGGDLYADGALGSRTAHVSEPYLDGDGCGHGVRDRRAGPRPPARLRRARHAGRLPRDRRRGDRHRRGRLRGGGRGQSGVDRLRAARHRVEHAEIMDKRLIAAFVEYGIVASVQPAFDRLWGGENQMYAQRLGVARALESNPMGAMHGVGVALAFGSDSPVTPLDPWGRVRAAMRHFNPVQRMSARAAFAAHTRGGWRAVHRDHEGVLAPGAPATFAVWCASAGISTGSLPSPRRRAAAGVPAHRPTWRDDL